VNSNNLRRGGISVVQGSSSDVTDNTIRMASTGVMILVADDIDCAENDISKCGVGIRAEDNDGASISRNVVKSCGFGIALLFMVLDADVRLNVVQDSTNEGILILGKEGTVSENLVTGSGGNGLEIDSVATGNAVALNVIKKSKGFDLLDQSGGANTIAADNQFGTTSP
jgi:nitrous oxidase accessory protein NosD